MSTARSDAGTDAAGAQTARERLERLRRAGRTARELSRLAVADPYGRLGMCILGVFLVIAVIAPAIAPMDPWANNQRADGSLARLDGPSLQHLLGTTYYGQDVLSQLLLGTWQTILVGIVTAILVGVIGTNIGLVSGYFGGIVDDVLMRITDFFYAIPFLPFMMVVVALVDRRLSVIIAAMAFIFWRTAARVVRAQVLSLKTRPYVLAARGSGAGHLRIMYVHILPNVLPLAFLYLIFGAAWAIPTG
jgi:peptide/nickel transport system permease protein